MKILASPRASGNPYQDLLYGAMRDEGDTVRYLRAPTRSASFNAAAFLPQIIFWRLCGYDVFHLHWTDAFQTPSKTLSYCYYRLCLAAIKYSGYKLVWTAHNALPHEPIFPDDIAAHRILVKNADLVIVHTMATIEELRALGMPPCRYAIIPHGNYIGAYPNTITRAEARATLGLLPDDFVYLYLGQVREYKGVQDLLCAHNDLHEQRSTLVIAGKCRDEGLRRKLLALRTSAANVIWHDQFVSDADLQTYFAAADVVVLPFEKITTSGSAILALSFGKAVIVPRLGDLALLPASVAFVYSPNDKSGLINALRRARNDKKELQQKSEAALSYIRQFSWPRVAAETHMAIKTLFKGLF